MNLFCGGKFLKRYPGKLISWFLGKDPWKLIFSFSDSEKLLSVLKLPAGLLSRKNYDFWKFWTCPESKSMHFSKFGHFLKNGFPGQTTVLTRRAAKFCVEPRSAFLDISHHDPETLGKSVILVSWPECRPGFPSDGADIPTTLPSGLTLPTACRNEMSRSVIPHFDYSNIFVSLIIRHIIGAKADIAVEIY